MEKEEIISILTIFIILAVLMVYIGYLIGYNMVLNIDLYPKISTDKTCLNYSYELKEKLVKAGYNASIICGWDENWTSGHTWVELILYIEPQSGEIMRKPYVFEHYRYCEDWYFENNSPSKLEEKTINE